MITSFTQYIEGVLESESTEQRDWRADIPSKLYRVNHALTGVATELGEILEAIAPGLQGEDVDWVGVKEELGDLWWYVALLTHLTERAETIHFADVYPRDGSTEALALCVRYSLLEMLGPLGQALDVVKRRIYYFAEELADGDEKKRKAEWTKVPVLEIIRISVDLVHAARLSLEDVWTTNLRKLIGPSGRYAGKFDPDKALHRDLTAERETLEGRAADVD